MEDWIDASQLSRVVKARQRSVEGQVGFFWRAGQEDFQSEAHAASCRGGVK